MTGFEPWEVTRQKFVGGGTNLADSWVTVWIVNDVIQWHVAPTRLGAAVAQNIERNVSPSLSSGGGHEVAPVPYRWPHKKLKCSIRSLQKEPEKEKEAIAAFMLWWQDLPLNTRRELLWTRIAQEGQRQPHEPSRRTWAFTLPGPFWWNPWERELEKIRSSPIVYDVWDVGYWDKLPEI